PEYDRTEFGIATVLQTGQTPYQWQYPEVVGGRPANEELVVYELLIRDFLESHSYDDLTDTLSYLKRMGVNAIELMPIMEFEGNESWGYNPSYALAPDKYYGTETDLREFIDQAHAEGFVVILDMVLNHHFGQSPMVRMYWDEANNRPAENSPWFNPEATHPFNVGYDFNHESAYTKAYMDDVNRFWIEEYEFDGYRFDLSKGFTQNKGKDPTDVGAWSNYDQSRVDILKRMADQIWAIDSNTYIILEHLGDNDEEKVLADYGMMLWGNLNHPYNDVINGKTGTDLNWALSSTRGWNDKNLMVYMESHDEERLMVRALNEGLSSGEYDIQNFDIALERIKMASAFFYTLPGPKMFWQFGELGYDFPINFNGRVGNKPIPWGDSDNLNYYSDEDRRRLYDAKAAIINLVNDYNEVFEGGEFSWTPSGQLRKINISHETMNVTIVGNFGISSGTITPSFQRTGTWYDFFSGSEYEVNSSSQAIELAPGEFHIYLDQPVDFPPPGLIDIFTPIINVEPGIFTIDDRIQIIFDAAAANPADTEGLIGAEKVYLYSGVVTDSVEGTTLTNIVGSTDADDGVGLMTKLPGDNEKWLISFRPREYYQLTSDQTAYRIGMYFRDASGKNVGKGRESDLIYVDITPSQSVVTVEPAAFTADDEIRIVFNAATANPADLVGAEKVYMHSGVVLTDTDAPGGGDWQNIVGNWGQDDGIGEMTPVPGSDDLWEITLTPRDYYSVDSSASVYYLAMVFRNADGTAEGKDSNGSDIFIRVSQSAPTAPAELMAEVVSPTQVNISWSDSADNELGYVIARAEFTDGPFVTIASLSENSTSYADTELKDGTTYYYRVQATSAYDPDSEFSNVASAELPLAAPTNLRATVQGKREIALSWVDNSVSETGYVVERTRRGWWRKLRYRTIATVDADVNSYTDNRAIPGIKYYYRIEAIQNERSSEYSNEVTVRINPQDYIDEIIKEIISTVVVYPNPASQWLRISWYQRDSRMVHIKIRNLAGNVLDSWSVQVSGFTSQEADVSSLEDGIYLVELVSGEERKIVRFAVRH
ncbi:MAG: alpha-amylase family glycosyl hydrolase, partial [Bacteroidota bacterium]